MTARLRMSVNAEADLRNILAFSEMRWGKRQRNIIGPCWSERLSLSHLRQQWARNVLSWYKD